MSLLLLDYYSVHKECILNDTEDRCWHVCTLHICLHTNSTAVKFTQRQSVPASTWRCSCVCSLRVNVCFVSPDIWFSGERAAVPNRSDSTGTLNPQTPPGHDGWMAVLQLAPLSLTKPHSFHAPPCVEGFCDDTGPSGPQCRTEHHHAVGLSNSSTFSVLMQECKWQHTYLHILLITIFIYFVDYLVDFLALSLFLEHKTCLQDEWTSNLCWTTAVYTLCCCPSCCFCVCDCGGM